MGACSSTRSKGFRNENLRDDHHPSKFTQKQGLSLQQKTALPVHFVGSVPLSSNTEVFQRLTSVFLGQLHRIPDGEVGKRDYFVHWQRAVFEKSPWILNSRGEAVVEEPTTDAPITLNPVEYDDYALSSYAEFCKLRAEGFIPQGLRLQICIPTPINTISVHIDPKYQAKVEVLYEEALVKALRRIQDTIPAHDLAIQWDCAIEFAFLEDIEHPIFSKAWFNPLKEGLDERFTRLAAYVDAGVEMGFHLCYGDVGHRHFVEPKNAAHLVEMANFVSSSGRRDVNWIHMPVPKSRTDDAYFEPLKELRMRKETKIYLGLAHAYDISGTRERIKAASRVLEDFGIASECGYGRTPKDDFESVMAVLATISKT